MSTQPTLPEALRTIKRFYRGTDCMAENQAGDWVRYEDHVAAATELRSQHARIAELEAELEAVNAASHTPPEEQQATKETSGGFHVWRDISTAPKDGSRFVAIGYNYGLYSEGRHICVAQWFRGCWMETSDWNEASELQHLTHWLPLPLPSPPDNAAELNDLDVSVSPQQAAPKAVPGDVLDEALRERDDAEDFIDALLDEVLGHERPEWSSSYGRADALNDVQERMTALHKPAVDKAWGRFQSAMAAPQQEAQGPSKAYAWVYVNKYGVDSIPASKDWCATMVSGHGGSMFPLYTAPQPAPVVGRMSPSKEWLETRLAIADDSDVQAGVPSKNARPCDAPPGCDSHNCHGCDDFKHPSPTPQPAPAPLSDREEIAMVDAAMVEMANIVPPLKRSECARLIRAAIAAQGGKV